MKKNITVHVLLLTLAIVAVFVIAQQTTIEVLNKEDLRTLSCGWPMEFVTNDQSWRDPPYPCTVRCLSREWGDRLTIRWYSFTINTSVLYFSFVFLLKAYCFAGRKRREMKL